MFGAALYRLRKKDFGALTHYHSISPGWSIGYDELERYYTKAEQMYQCMVRAAKTLPNRLRAHPIRSPPCHTNRAYSA